MANDDIISLFGSKKSQITVAKCGNHPEIYGVNTCDSCNRYLCDECLGPPQELNSRVYYFCKDEACQKKYKATLRPRIFSVLILLWVLVFPLTTLFFYIFLNLLDFDGDFTVRHLGKSIVYAALVTGSMYKILRGRQKKSD